LTVAPDNADDRPGPTPVPPRGGKRKPNRPPAKRPAGARPGAQGRSTGSSAAGRPADARRAALAQQRRRKQTFLAGGAVVVIIAVIAVFVVIKATGGSTKSDTTATAVGASSLDNFTSAVSLQEMKAAAANYPLNSESEGAYAGYPLTTSDTPITTTGKPELLYIGAEYCPYCATERWPLVLALSKFGTFHNLSAIHSSATDVFPSTPTFSFYKSTYSSPYLTFTSVETETVDEKPLQTLTKAQETIANKYDNAGSIPFVYFNGKATITGAEYNPALLKGLTFQQIADSIAGGTSKLASSVAADAGAIVAAICQMTGGKPASVCSLFPTPITS
jgi:type II secretory pathway pseudopilin PulG